ncbi:MAG TPA: glycosyltransferase family 2 protein [Candidatus Udaeobacter sp.]|nr:glycosyltransferase family 2 protein [Candidatus Udaeobacter sp.]
MQNEIELLLPADDCPNPEVSLVVPALNEQISIGRFVEWCREGLLKAGVQGEILIVDSSTDNTPAIAVEKGARVLRTPRRGLGRAYIDALGYVRGKYVIMGDCDCTYDFREIGPFIEDFRKGSEFIMGSRFKGYIETGAMPPLHRYFGTPITTSILNFMYGCHFSDIHCGMRGLTLDSYRRLDLKAQKWEYASEMIIKAVHIGLKTSEVPIRFLKGMQGRTSHLNRHWYIPWLAGWQNLRAFFIFKPDFFLRKPGYFFSFLGFFLVFALGFGPISMGKLVLSLHSQIFGLFLLALGTSFLEIDALATLFLGFQHKRIARIKRLYNLDKTAPISLLLVLIGLVFVFYSAADWIGADFRLFTVSHGFVAGLGFILLGVQLFLKSLTIALFSLEARPQDDHALVRQ